MNPLYGFSNCNYYDISSYDTNKCMKYATNSGTNARWWLRSAYSGGNNLNVAVIDTLGWPNSAGGSYSDIAVRFALNIPLSYILFAQDSNSTASTPSSTFTAIPSTLTRTKFIYDTTDASVSAQIYIEGSESALSTDVTPPGSKLTIVDNTADSPRKDFWIPQGKYKVARTSASPTNITIPYRHAATGSGEYISAIIKESDDATSYYARLKSLSNPVDANGTVTMTIPAELQNGSYKLIMMSEKDNGPYRTNYAKNYNLRLYVDENNVTITGDGAAGVCTIENPKYKEDGSEYNRVYFGKTPTLDDDENNIQLFRRQYATNARAYMLHNDPIYWRVLNTTANDKSGTPALFMLTEYCITNNMSWDNNPKENTDASSYENYGQRWSKEADKNDNYATTDCAIKIFLNGQAGGIYNGRNEGTSYNNNVNTSGAVYTEEDSEHCAYNDCFDEKERNIIMSTYNGEITQDSSNYDINSSDTILWNYNNDSTGNRYGCGCGLTGEKLFLLSAKEVTEEKYGFEGSRELNFEKGTWKYLKKDPNRRTKQYANVGSNSHWWLRSASSSRDNLVAYVSSSGFSDSAYSNGTDIAVRFALNIPLSSVLFASDASSIGASPSHSFAPVAQIELSRTTINYPESSGTAGIDNTIESAPTGVDTTVYTANTDGNMTTSPTPSTISYGAGAKLTIVDNSSEFAVTQDIARATAGSSIDVDYTNASVGYDKYISAIIKDTSGYALYHARLDSVSTPSGTVSMNIPSELEPGEYMLVIYNELERGSYNTNYAGYDTLILIVSDANNPDNESPIMTNVYKNLTGTRFKFTASDNQELYQVTNSSRAKLRDLSGTNVTTNMSCGTQSSILVEDLAGNTSELQNILTDTTPPTVNISYNNGTYTLTVSDNESGVWKITNRDGTVVYRDYSC